MTGAELAAALRAADERLAAAQADYDALPFAGKQAALDPGGFLEEAQRARQAAADAYWEYHEGPAATAAEVAEFIMVTGRPPAAPGLAAQVRNLVAVARAEAFEEALQPPVTTLVDVAGRIAAGLGHDLDDPGVRAVIAAVLRQADT